MTKKLRVLVSREIEVEIPDVVSLLKPDTQVDVAELVRYYLMKELVHLFKKDLFDAVCEQYEHASVEVLGEVELE